jgi:hypothetical protein
MPSDEIYRGLNASPIDDRFVRCARCGFPCKLDRDVRAALGSKMGWAIRYIVSYTETIISSVITDQDEGGGETTPPVSTVDGVTFLDEQLQFLGDDVTFGQ